METRAALLLNVTLTRSHNWITGNGEWQLVNNHARELLAAHIDALPETRGSKQHRVGGRTKCSQQCAFRCAALNEARIIRLRRDPLVQLIHARQTCGKHKRAPFRCSQYLNYLIRSGTPPLGRAWVRHPRRQVKYGLIVKIKDGFRNHLLCFVETEPFANKVEAAGARQRCGS